MHCPRCGGNLTEYRLDGKEALECRSCGYVGVPTDHHGTPTPAETWAESLRRFRREHDVDADAYRTLRIGNARYRVSPAIFDRISEMTDKQRAVLRELLREPEPSDPDRSLTAIGESADAHRSYIREILETYGDLADALQEDEVAIS